MAEISKAKKLLGDVKYEIGMANLAAQSMTKKGTPQAINVLLESFLLHSKNMFEFFTLASSNGNRELIAKDYTNQWKPFIALHKMPITKKFIPKMDGYLLHLSYDRLKKKPLWPVGKMLKEINSNWKDFIKYIK